MLKDESLSSAFATLDKWEQDNFLLFERKKTFNEQKRLQCLRMTSKIVLKQEQQKSERTAALKAETFYDLVSNKKNGAGQTDPRLHCSNGLHEKKVAAFFL